MGCGLSSRRFFVLVEMLRDVSFRKKGLENKGGWRVLIGGKAGDVEIRCFGVRFFLKVVFEEGLGVGGLFGRCC